MLTADGTAQVVTVTINGANDAAVISGTASGNVIEAGGVEQRHAGHADRDGRSQRHRCRQCGDSWQAVAAGAASANGFGTLRDDRGRGVDLHAGQRNATVQALNGSATLTDTFTVLTADGTAQVVTVTINGANDAAVISGTSTGAVVEAGGVANAHARHADRDGHAHRNRCRQSGDVGRR